jgi:uncharacterized membrane protein YccC
MSQSGGLSSSGQRCSDRSHASRLMTVLRSVGPPLLFGLRLWVAVCLALYIAFWLQLDNAYWAGTSAAVVSQPTVGASLRKGWFRLIGTVVGAVAIVVLTACFPQDRVAFLVGLALWGAACALAATLLHNFAAVGAALAGITAAVIASDQLGAAGGANGQAFMLAITRVSEISIGIVCAGVVLAGTDLGGAPRRLATQLAAIATEIMERFTDTLSGAGLGPSDTRAVRRELTRRVIALDPVIDETIGESSRLRYHSPVLKRAVDGLIAALAGWRTVADHIELIPADQARAEALVVLRGLPPEPRPAPAQGEPSHWITSPVHVEQVYDAAAKALTSQKAGTPSLRLLADHTAEFLAGMSQVLDGLALLGDDPDRSPRRGRGGVRLRVPDWLPCLVNAGRAFVTIGIITLFWIFTAWPNGSGAMTFAAIGVVLLGTRGDQAYTAALIFALGAIISAVLAAIVKFAVLPDTITFAGFCCVIGVVLVPVGALMAQPWRTALFIPMSVYFIPLLAPANQMVYDTQQFYNASYAILAGLGSAALAFRLLPPLAPEYRTRRLLALTLRDLRRLAISPTFPATEEWRGRGYNRIAALPEQAEPLQRAQTVAALMVGSEIIKLRLVAPEFALGSVLRTTLEAVAHGNVSSAIAGLTDLDRAFASASAAGTNAPIALRARGSILAMSEALREHAVYFETREFQ